MSWEDAVAELSAPGQPFELEEVELERGSVRAFRRAPATLRQLVDNASQFGDATFSVFEKERVSYDEAIGIAGQLRSGLAREFGLESGDRVAIAMRNLPEWLQAFMAIVGSPWIAVPINGWWTTDEIDYALRDSGARVVIADEARADRIAAGAHRDLPVVVARPTRELRDGEIDFDRLISSGRAPRTLSLASPRPDDIASILYTSGTMGRPKGAICTHRNVSNAIMGFHMSGAIGALRSGAGGTTTQPAMLVAVPLFHVTGCHTIFLTSLLSGRKLVVMERWDADDAIRLIEEERISAFTGVPTMVWDMLRSEELAHRDTSSLRVIGNGGAPASAELSRRVEANFEGRPGHGYGMTETSGAGAQVNGDDHLAQLGSPGRPPLVLEIEAFDESHRLLPRGESGELRMRGAVVTPGYWGNEEATKDAFVDGWFRSGDVGHLDDEGFLYIDGRSKDMVLRGGENVYCVEVERAMQELEAVLEVVVYGLPDDRLGEIVGATVYARDAGLGADAIAQSLEGRIARFKIPQRVRIVGEPLPRLASGKFDKRAVARDHAAEDR